MNDTFNERVAARLKERGIGSRQDLEMHDARVLESGRAVRVLAVYSPVFGPPTAHDVQKWVESRMQEYGGQVSARADTIALYPERNFLTFILETKTVRAPISASTGMIKAGVDQYLDNANTLWEVVKAEKGPSFLVRKDGVSIERMLEIRKQALRGNTSSRKNVMLANLDSMPAVGGGYATAEVGDVVDFYSGSTIYRGKIVSVGKTGVKIKPLSGGKDAYTVDPQAIMAIIDKSEASSKQLDDTIRRYYSNIYPGNPKMVEEISPLSSRPVSFPRGKITPLSGSAAPPTPSVETAIRPTERVLGKLPGARAAKR